MNEKCGHSMGIIFLLRKKADGNHVLKMLLLRLSHIMHMKNTSWIYITLMKRDSIAKYLAE